MVDSHPKDTNSILYISFNQDSSCFALGTENGFCIYNTIPFKDSFIRDMKGGIGIIEMLNRSNILALVGGGKNPKYAKNKLIIWDDHRAKVISELRFNSEVKNVKLTRQHIYVVCALAIYEFDFMTFKNTQTFQSPDNHKGLFSIAVSSNIIAYPGNTCGSIAIHQSNANSETEKINAHQNPLSCLSLNKDGSLVASTSEKGTIIRVFSTVNNVCLKELRRGTENAEIYSIAFDNLNKFVACTSDRKTIHLFELVDSKNSNANDTEGNNLEQSTLTKSSKGLKTERSVFKFKVNDSKAICTFGNDDTVVVITGDGKYHRFRYDAKTGESAVVEEKEIPLSC